MANLQLKTVSKIFPSGALALYKVNLELADREFIAVIGGEKSGKSTLLRLIAGLEEVTEGEIIVGDKDVTKEPSRDRDIAMIFQGNSLYPSLNIYDNISYGLKLRKAAQPLIEQRVKAAAEILGLTDILYRKPKALTAEQKQLVAFARAIVREPKLYLLDDPLTGIAPEVRANLRSTLINLQARMNGTFMYATKNVNDALTMATRILVLREGFVQQIDTPANLYDYPVNAYVAFMIGSPTINFINNAKIVKDGDKYFAEVKGVKLPLAENIAKRFTDIDAYARGDKQVIIGLRPEDMGVGEGGFIKAKVAAAEQICGATYAECDGEGLTFVVKADVKKGDEVTLFCDLERVYVFDSETRLNLLERDEGYKKTDLPDSDFKPLTYGEEETLKKKLKLPDSPKKKK